MGNDAPVDRLTEQELESEYDRLRAARKLTPDDRSRLQAITELRRWIATL